GTNRNRQGRSVRAARKSSGGPRRAMAIAPSLTRPPTESAPRSPSKSMEREVPEGDATRACSPDEVLVTAILERSVADVGWLAWGDGSKAVVVPGVARSFLSPVAIG